MISCGLKGIEVYHSSHSKEEMNYYLKIKLLRIKLVGCILHKFKFASDFAVQKIKIGPNAFIYKDQLLREPFITI